MRVYKNSTALDTSFLKNPPSAVVPIKSKPTETTVLAEYLSPYGNVGLILMVRKVRRLRALKIGRSSTTPLSIDTSSPETPSKYPHKLISPEAIIFVADSMRVLSFVFNYTVVVCESETEKSS